MNIKWELEKFNQEIYDTTKNNDPELINYLNISDAEIFKIKIYDMVKYM